MKIALALLAILAATTSVHAGVACATVPPIWAQQAPTVPFHIVYLPPQDMARACHKLASALAGPLLGCAYLRDRTGQALIVISNDQVGADRACVLLYELSHLPPNGYYNPAMEAGAPDDPKLVRPTNTPWSNLRDDNGSPVVKRSRRSSV